MRKRHKTRYPGVYYRLVDEERPDGPRRYIVWYADANGDGHTETLPVGLGLEDARLRQSQLKTRRSQGDTLVPTKLTVGELLDHWMGLRDGSLGQTTSDTYRWAIDSHLKKHLGRRKLADLSADDVARMISILKREGMKTWTVRKILTPLGGALRVAVREGWITSSPLDKLLPHERPKADQREMKILSKDEIPKLFAGASSTLWRTLFATLVFTGLRIGEALALTWDDVDENINVRKSKTDAGVRQIMLMPALRRLLSAWKLQQAPGHQFVFTNASGAPLNRRDALRALRAAEKRAGLPEYTLHELRHTFASILIGQGELPTFVANQMGHSDPAITMSTYVKLWEKQENADRARERLEAAFGGMV